MIEESKEFIKDLEKWKEIFIKRIKWIEEQLDDIRQMAARSN